MQLSTLVPYYLVKWHHSGGMIWTCYALYFFLLLALPIPAVMLIDFSSVLKFAFLGEQVRMLMKVHAFVAECTWMANDKDKKEKMHQVTVKHLMYFLFAPTLVFRLTYPRNERRDWTRVVAYGGQFVLVCAVTFMTIPSYCQRNLSSYGTPAFGHKSLPQLILLTVPLAILTCFSIFYGMLHCWMNFWGELLLFADRR